MLLLLWALPPDHRLWVWLCHYRDPATTLCNLPSWVLTCSFNGLPLETCSCCSAVASWGPSWEFYPIIHRLCCYYTLLPWSKPLLILSLMLLLHFFFLPDQLWPAVETQTLVPWKVCTFSHLRDQYQCNSRYICARTLWHVLHAPDPSTPNLLSLWVPACQIKHQEWSLWLELLPMGKRGQQEDPRRFPLRIVIAIATPAIHRNSAVLATEDFHSLCQCWPQMMELHRDYASLPSQEPKTLYTTQPVPLQWSSDEDIPSEASPKWMEEVTTSSNMQTSMQSHQKHEKARKGDTTKGTQSFSSNWSFKKWKSVNYQKKNSK